MCSTSKNNTTRQVPGGKGARIGFDDLRIRSKRRPRQPCAMRPQLDADHPLETRKMVAWHRPAALEQLGLGKQSEHQTLAASDVEQPASRRQPSAEQHVSIHRIAAQLSARELPRRNTRRGVTVGGGTRQSVEERIVRAATQREIGRDSSDRRQARRRRQDCRP